MRRTSIQQMDCVSCGSQSWMRFLKVGGFVIEECQVCRLGRTRITRKDKEKVDEKFYGDEYRAFYTDQKTRAFLKKRFRKRIKRALPHLEGVEKVLDVGCSYGHFLEVAKDFGWDVVGLEPNMYIYKHLLQGKEGIRIINSTLRKTSFEKKHDLVTYWDVLEHIQDPDRELCVVHKLLRSQGYLIVQCPNKASWGVRLSGSKWGWWSPPDHIYHFTPGSLRRLVEKSGFSILFIETYNDEEEILRGIFNRLSLQSSPRAAAYVDLMHQMVQRIGYPLLYPIRKMEEKSGNSGLIFMLAQAR